MKTFIKDNLTDIEKKDANEYLHDKVTNKLYREIIELYDYSLHENTSSCAA